MKSKGNGNPERCAYNLLLITRGEVPYERIKGLDPKHIDRPGNTVNPEVKADIEWLINTYEPRINIDKTDIAGIISEEGHFGFNIDTFKQGV